MMKSMKEKMKNRKGFTLVELVVVIAILGILAAIAVPKLSQSRVNAAIAAHNANVRTLESAATMAVAEGVGDGATETSPIEWDGTDAANDLNYVQAWPKVPELLKGKDGKDENDVAVTVTVDSVYKVKIYEGTIVVTPVKIKELD